MCSLRAVDGAGTLSTMADATSGKTPNSGIKGGMDTYPCVPSTLTSDFADIGLVVRPFKPSDIEQCRELFRQGLDG